MSHKPNIVGAAKSTLALLLLGTLPVSAAVYDFGNPTGEEQLYIELINRARANPTAEGTRLRQTSDPNILSAYNVYEVDLVLFQNEMQSIPATPPLVPNAKLMTAARGHSQWMLANDTQSHNQSTTNTPFSRILATGYSYTSAGENIFAYCPTPEYGHAGFEVDWGGSAATGGMQTGRGHRGNIHSSQYREIGAGVANGTNTRVGPQLITQDFGNTSNTSAYGSGVAYYDLNSNYFYDVGEGIAGLNVSMAGTNDTCTTAIGGGWVIPGSPTAATRAVTFSGLNVNNTINVVFPGTVNAKGDLKLTYTPPNITSTANLTYGSPYTLTYSAIGGATGYKWKEWAAVPAPPENCESILGLTISQTGVYSVANTLWKHEGNSSFHLENSTGDTQSFELPGIYYANPLAELTFQGCLRYATSDQHARVQIKPTGGDWFTVYSQTGTNNSGEIGFSAKTVALAGFQGKSFQVRFVFHQDTYGSCYGGYTGEWFGWFVDSINFNNVEQLNLNGLGIVTGTTATFTPTPAAKVMVTVAPIISGMEFPASTKTLVLQGTPPVITVQPENKTVPSGARVTLSVTATGATGYQWYSGLSGDITTPLVGGTNATFTTLPNYETQFYWVQVRGTGGTTNSQRGTVTILPNYHSWAIETEDVYELPIGSLENPMGDFDRDGHNNLLEFAFGGDPTSSDDAFASFPEPQPSPTHLILRYQKDTSMDPVISITPQMSTDGTIWAGSGFTDTVIETDGTVETREARIPFSTGGTRFLRIKVTQP